ncbi:hypothetical protein N7451_012187 [Penicillium sp. IBT 35674x]|nr:hypothetical protein N7451_012187 [Penicillium sp. IBT 35674x]
MLFLKCLLLAPLTISAFSARLQGHARRQAVPTTTVTELINITACPYNKTSTLVWTTSAMVTPTPTPEQTSTPEPTASAVSTTSSAKTTSSVVVSTSAGGTSTAAAIASSSSASWTEIPANGVYSTSGFGASTNPSGSGDTYIGNVGSPYGSNIITVSQSDASSYKYVIQFNGSNTEDWQVVIWNKYSSDGNMDGWYGKACHSFTLTAGETKYWAFDTNSQGGWAAAKGSTIPTNAYGSYASTWGEFDFGSTVNSGWSGFDVSAITAQEADMPVQGMRICDVYNTHGTCSSITTGAGTVTNAYTAALSTEGGIGGSLSAGPVRLSVVIDYDV